MANDQNGKRETGEEREKQKKRIEKRRVCENEQRPTTTEKEKEINKAQLDEPPCPSAGDIHAVASFPLWHAQRNNG